MTVRLCILASPQDSTHRLDLEKQLAPHRELLSYWCVSNILPGNDVFSEIERELRRAQIVVWLITPDFRFTEEQSAEARLTLDLERTGSLRVIPVLVRNTTHYAAPYAGRAVFPDNKLPVTAWQDRDLAWRNVVAGIRRVAEEISGIASGYGPVMPLSLPSPRLAPPAPSGPVSFSRISAPPVSVPLRPSHPAVSVRSEVTPPPAPSTVEQAPLQSPVAAPPSPSEKRAPPRRSRRGWVLGLTGIAVLAVLWLVIGRQMPLFDSSHQSPSPFPTESPTKPVSPKPMSAPCCGGVDCPEDQHQGRGTTCDSHPEECRPCRSGRRRVAGSCSDAIPSSNVYGLRYAGATLRGYVPGFTDTICVQAPGSTPSCATVAAAQKTPLPGTIAIGTMSTARGLDVWFERAGVRMWAGSGMHLDPARAAYTNSALCIGAVLYSPDKGDILRFYLDDP